MVYHFIYRLRDTNISQERNLVPYDKEGTFMATNDTQFLVNVAP